MKGLRKVCSETSGNIDSPKTQEEIREIIAETLERRCIA